MIPFPKQQEFLSISAPIKIWQAGKGAGTTTVLLLSTLRYKNTTWVVYSGARVREVIYEWSKLLKDVFKEVKIDLIKNEIYFNDQKLSIKTSEDFARTKGEPLKADLIILDQLQYMGKDGYNIYHKLKNALSDLIIAITPVSLQGSSNETKIKFGTWVYYDIIKPKLYPIVHATVFDNPVLMSNTDYVELLKEVSEKEFYEGVFE